MDPILEEDLKKRRMKRMQQYKAYLEQADKADKNSEAEGNLQGKKVKKLPSENSPIKNLFKPLP
jgi:hypothetical protein